MCRWQAPASASTARPFWLATEEVEEVAGVACDYAEGVGMADGRAGKQPADLAWEGEADVELDGWCAGWAWLLVAAHVVGSDPMDSRAWVGAIPNWSRKSRANWSARL